MKKFCLFAIAVLMLLVLASCAEPVTPVAYSGIRFQGSCSGKDESEGTH